MHSPEMLVRDRLQACNHTELYQLCLKARVPASPSMTREQLIDALVGEDPRPMGITNPVDSWRHGLAGFVLDHWKTLQNQVTCPLKSGDPTACFGCLDIQVVTCIIRNPNNEQLIQRYRK